MTKKRRIYRTRNRLFFVEIGIFEQLKRRVERFVDENGMSPEKIYVTREVMDKYKAYFPRRLGGGFDGGVYFRGIRMYEMP